MGRWTSSPSTAAWEVVSASGVGLTEPRALVRTGVVLTGLSIATSRRSARVRADAREAVPADPRPDAGAAAGALGPRRAGAPPPEPRLQAQLRVRARAAAARLQNREPGLPVHGVGDGRIRERDLEPRRRGRPRGRRLRRELRRAVGV